MLGDYQLDRRLIPSDMKKTVDPKNNQQKQRVKFGIAFTQQWVEEGSYHNKVLETSQYPISL